MGLAVNECTNSEAFCLKVVRLLGQHYDWPFATIIQQKSGMFVLQAAYANDTVRTLSSTPLSSEVTSHINHVINSHRVTSLSGTEIAEIFTLCKPDQTTNSIASGIAAPLLYHTPGETGILVIGIGTSGPAQADREVLEALAEHIAASWESLKLAENRRELARMEERNRLARDLHDSVNQILFSLSLTAKGAESMLSGSEPAPGNGSDEGYSGFVSGGAQGNARIDYAGSVPRDWKQGCSMRYRNTAPARVFKW